MVPFSEIFRDDGTTLRDWSWIPTSELLKRVDYGLYYSAHFVQALKLFAFAEHMSVGCVMSCNLNATDAVESLRRAILAHKKVKRIDVHFSAACRGDRELQEVWKPLADRLKRDGIDMTVKCGHSWPKLEEL